MKLTYLALSLFCLAACHTAPHESTKSSQDQPAASTRAELDFATYAGRNMTGEEFVRACQQVSGFNFTYSEDTAKALKSASMRLPDEKHVAATEFEKYLDARLLSAGFSCKRIGPDQARVYLVERRAG